MMSSQRDCQALKSDPLLTATSFGYIAEAEVALRLPMYFLVGLSSVAY